MVVLPVVRTRFAASRQLSDIGSSPAGTKIAVIGGGVAGMSAAWHLHEHGFDVKVFERNGRIGGDVQTIDVMIGGEKRWVDLGVNDFNASTYRHLVTMFDRLGVEYLRLEDTSCYFTLDGSVLYTSDGRWGTAAPEAIKRDVARFSREAPEVLTNPAYKYTLVKEYVKEQGYSDEFVRHNLYPRINGMYFFNREDIGSTLLWPVMRYYSLQEGLNHDGPPRAERMYFVDGSAQWMEKLYEAAKAKFPIALNAEASIRASSSGVTVYTRDHVERFDKVVLTQQAWDALRCVKDGLTAELASFLGSFDYYDDEVVVHNYYGVLPPRVGAWRTYNILIRGNVTAPSPYLMTYAVNRHQNDTFNPEYLRVGTPHFFASVNPPVPIPDTNVLRQPDGTPARMLFRHTACNLKAVRAQERRSDLQGINNIYVTGGYARGVGLHEECWIDGMELAAHIKRAQEYGPVYEYSSENDYYPPRGVRETVTTSRINPPRS